MSTTFAFPRIILGCGPIVYTGTEREKWTVAPGRTETWRWAWLFGWRGWFFIWRTRVWARAFAICSAIFVLKNICTARVYCEYQTGSFCSPLDGVDNYSLTRCCNDVEVVDVGEADNCRLDGTRTEGWMKYMNITYYRCCRQHRSSRNQTASSRSNREDRP